MTARKDMVTSVYIHKEMNSANNQRALKRISNAT
jgi:hypothetical protein